MDWTTIASGAGLTGAVVGLLVWLSKQSFKRQAEVTDRYFKHLETERAESREERTQNRQVLQELSRSVNQNTESVRELARAVSGSCKHPLGRES